MTLAELIGQRIKTCREEMGLSQTQLAVELGFESATAISLIERGERSLSIENLLKLPSILNQPVGYFVGNDEKIVPEQKTLRDEFAMAGLISIVQKQDHYYPKEASKMSYAIADAMLEARKKNGV